MEVKAEEEIKSTEEIDKELQAIADAGSILNNKEDATKSAIAFAPEVDPDESKSKSKIAQLAVDNELQRKVRESKEIYVEDLEKLYDYGLKWVLKGKDPVGINGCVFQPYTTYKIGNRIISPDGAFLITNDLMQCALSIDSAAIKNEKKITQAGGGSVEMIEKGGVIIKTTIT